MYVAVISSTGIRLMPTTCYRARKFLKDGRAIIANRKPFTIRLTGRESGAVQPVEYKCDTGYSYIGVSVVSEKHEYVSAQYDTLQDEVAQHEAQARNRRNRRNRLRHREPRFTNRVKKEGWLAPSIRHKKDLHEDVFRAFYNVIPITSATFEMGQFDTQLLKALEEGLPIPQGVDYQLGEGYGTGTLREAVFSRDNYTCQCCGRKLKDGAILHVHHLGYLKHDHSNRMANLATICEKCHTPANHKKGGKLYNLKPKNNGFKGATFMSTVRWFIYDELSVEYPDVNFNTTYGAATKLQRHIYHVSKSHVNDAYIMGQVHPKHRCDSVHYKKVRRNDRILQKFFDAVYVDTRTGEKVKAGALPNGRIKRGRWEENLKKFRGVKVKNGFITIRRQRTQLKPGSMVQYNGEMLTVHGTHTSKGKTNVEFASPAKDGRKSVAINKVTVVSHSYNTGWQVA
jgi:hypothetical protein